MPKGGAAVRGPSPLGTSACRNWTVLENHVVFLHIGFGGAKEPEIVYFITKREAKEHRNPKIKAQFLLAVSVKDYKNYVLSRASKNS